MSEGMAMIYGFNHDEAQRLFRRAAELDPSSPMPWWGIALSWGSHINNEPEAARETHAWEAIAKAQTLATVEHEKRYVEALAKRYSPDEKVDRKQLARNYAAAMKSLHRDHPDDPDAAVLYAESLMNLNPWKYWTKDGQPEDGTLEFVDVLERVLTRWPEHPGANHYYIHAVEASPYPERALAAANRLAALVPTAGHLVHMPSHIYARTGDWGPAAASNAEAVRVDREYLKGKPQDGLYPLMYYPHNIHFLLYARAAQGECGAAEEAGRDLVAQVSPGLDAMPMLQGFVGYVHQLSVWCPSLPLGAPPAAKYALAAVAYRYAEGMRTTDRKMALARLRDAAKNVAPETLYEVQYTKAYLTIAEESIVARIAEDEGRRDAAVQAWQNAVMAYDRLRYDEPPLWFYPVRQSLAAALLRFGQAAEAERVVREGLSGQRRDPRMQFVLWQALERQGKAREAALVAAEFRAVWKGPELPRLEDL
ncbi:MAG: hypothetical protein FJW30_10230 [Acidobacteria bacterium]|nr:hypothetical protein [Acidobacteriota bacterium]